MLEGGFKGAVDIKGRQADLSGVEHGLLVGRGEIQLGRGEGNDEGPVLGAGGIEVGGIVGETLLAVVLDGVGPVAVPLRLAEVVESGNQDGRGDKGDA